MKNAVEEVFVRKSRPHFSGRFCAVLDSSGDLVGIWDYHESETARLVACEADCELIQVIIEEV